MRIGELSKRSTITVETIRYYEQKGLLPHPARSSNNYRRYNQQHLERLLFIRNGRKLGMPLDELKVLLQFRESSFEGCEQVNDLLDQQIMTVGKRIEELNQLKEQLQTLRQRCSGGRSTAQCAILCELSRVSKAQSGIANHDLSENTAIPA